MRPLRVLPKADADVDEAADHYADHGGLDLGLRFLNAVQEAYDFIAENPQAGPGGHYQDSHLQKLRRWPVPGFENYLVFYHLVGDCVEIVRVLHGARDIEVLLESEE